jgi:hypothetical protein
MLLAPVDPYQMMRPTKPADLRFRRQVFVDAVAADISAITLEPHAQLAVVELNVAGSVWLRLSRECRHAK